MSLKLASVVQKDAISVCVACVYIPAAMTNALLILAYKVIYANYLLCLGDIVHNTCLIIITCHLLQEVSP